MSKTIRHYEGRKYSEARPVSLAARESRKQEGRFGEALRKQREGYVKHPKQWRDWE